MVIDDFNLVRVPFLKSEANAPLIVDRDRMLTDTAASEGVQPVARRDTQIVQRRCCIEHIEFSERTADDRGWEYPRSSRAVQISGFCVRKRGDHGKM
jgi:hypothetical protein